MGSRRDAFTAGYKPKNTPIADENSAATTIALGGIEIGHSNGIQAHMIQQLQASHHNIRRTN